MTDWLTRLRPEPGGSIDPATATPTSDGGGAARLLQPVEDALGHVPPLVWVGLLLATGLAAAVTLPIARRHARLAGARAAGHTATGPRDGALFLAAMIPAALFLTAVLAGSFRGLTAFGRDELRWTDGWEYLVPLTLDGVALSFGFLAFRAIRKQQSPDRANRLVWAAALASAVINFTHEARLPYGSWLGGAYLALMSVFGMLIFHEFLAQFEEGAEAVHRKTPKFGLRWITWPTNTACAWIAWHNHPAPDGTLATVAEAVAHLERVREVKRTRAATQTVSPWWTPIVPWVRIRQLDAIAEAERSAASDQRAVLASEIETLRSAVTATVERGRSDLAEQIAAIRAEQEAERTTAQRVLAHAERQTHALRSALTEQAERLSNQHAEQLLRVRTEHAEQIAALRDTQTETAGRNGRSNVTPIRRTKTAGRSANPMATDDGALAAMFTEHPEADFVWTDREVNRITGAGFSSRAPRLVGAATNHQKTCPAEQHSECFAERQDDTDDPKEGSRVPELASRAG